MSLKTDLYQITMLGAYYKKGLTKRRVSCEAFARKMPPNRNFFVMAGTEEIRNYLLNLRFTDDEIRYIKTIPQVKPLFNTSNFEDYLRDFKFTGDFWAMAEGEICYAEEPLIRITGTLPEAHMAETFILSVLNHDIRVASKASRIVLACRGKEVLEFSMRRGHHEASVNVARSAYLAGFSATSNVEAGMRYNIPLAGTMSHMWVMIADNEAKAFQDFRDVYNTPTLLIDTYDTIKGIELAQQIKGLQAIRIDSGDLSSLSWKARRLLDMFDCRGVKIVVSGDLNEYKIDDLFYDRCPIDIFAVGTELVAPSDTQSLGIVYKVVYDEDNKKPLIKLSPNKTTIPAKKQVYQKEDENHHLLAVEGVSVDKSYIPLLDLHIKDGKLQEEVADVNLETARMYCNSCLLNLPSHLADLESRNYQMVRLHKSVEDIFHKLKG